MPEATQGPSDEDETPAPAAKGGIEALTIIQAKKGLALNRKELPCSTASLMARVAKASSELEDLLHKREEI
jgi:hypothetical protein